MLMQDIQSFCQCVSNAKEPKASTDDDFRFQLASVFARFDVSRRAKRKVLAIFSL